MVSRKLSRSFRIDRCRDPDRRRHHPLRRGLPARPGLSLRLRSRCQNRRCRTRASSHRPRPHPAQCHKPDDGSSHARTSLRQVHQIPTLGGRQTGYRYSADSCRSCRPQIGGRSGRRRQHRLDPHQPMRMADAVQVLRGYHDRAMDVINLKSPK